MLYSSTVPLSKTHFTILSILFQPSQVQQKSSTGYVFASVAANHVCCAWSGLVWSAEVVQEADVNNERWKVVWASRGSTKSHHGGSASYTVSISTVWATEHSPPSSSCRISSSPTACCPWTTMHCSVPSEIITSTSSCAAAPPAGSGLCEARSSGAESGADRSSAWT